MDKCISVYAEKTLLSYGTINIQLVCFQVYQEVVLYNKEIQLYSINYIVVEKIQDGVGTITVERVEKLKRK